MDFFRLVVFLILLVPFSAAAQFFSWELIDSGTDASFRSLSVVNDSVAWVGGTKGWIGRTSNGGRTWKFTQVPGFEQMDFRTLYAHDGRNAVIANAGSPANILITNDGGRNWYTVFTLRDTAAFIDGIDFWNRNEGLIYGDPIKGRMLMLRTIDGGITWAALPDEQRPILNEGEASFAASGTAIRCAGKSSVVIASGGRTSRLWRSEDKGKSWFDQLVPVIQGESSTGIFSVALSGKRNMIVVGGNYLVDSLKKDHVFYSFDGGGVWKKPEVPTRGYRECVEYINEKLLLATGPGGTDVSLDGGVSWRRESDEKGFHVVRKARKGSLILIAGTKGKIGIVKIKGNGN